jgi:RNA-directed DNA polymerase
MISDSPHLYHSVGRARGIDEELILGAIEQASRVERRGMASVLSLNHLATRTGASYNYLRDVVARNRDPYHVFRIRRKSGKSARVISSPSPTMMHVQRWILDRILNHAPVHSSSYAFRAGRSIRACAERHVGCQWLVKLDIHNFFHSIDERQVYGIFHGLGYEPLPAFEMARLCTRMGARATDRSFRPNPASVREMAISEYTARSLGYLPQGAPSSGAIANLVARVLDDSLTELAQSQNLIYTRYADDITFSGFDGFSRKRAAAIIRAASLLIQKAGFIAHEKKTRLVPPGARRIVLGILVDGDRVRLPKDFRSRVQAHVYGAAKFGLVSHQQRRQFSSILGMILHVDGLLAFAHDIDPEWASEKWLIWRELVRNQAPDFAHFGPAPARKIDPWSGFNFG